MAIDEDPSPEDLERFDHEDAHCPECGAEVWDQAEFCPACGTQVGGHTVGGTRRRRWRRKRWLLVVGLIALLAFLVAVLGFV